MTNCAGDVIDDFYAEKDKAKKEQAAQEEAVETKKAKQKFILERIGDLARITVGDTVYTGEVSEYYLQRVDNVDSLTLVLEWEEKEDK